MAAGDPRLRYLYAIWSFFECLGFGGLIYGWGSLVFVLKDEGLYLDQLCGLPLQNSMSNSTQSTSGETTQDANTDPFNCQARDDKFNLVFTVGSSMLCVGSFVMGQISFKFGTRVTRLVALVLFTGGALMIAFTSNDAPWLIFPGLSLVGVGGIVLLMTNKQVSLLFPTGGGLVVGLIGGAMDASAGVQQMVKLGYENGISRQTSYIILAACHLLTLVNTLVFLPKDFVKKQELNTTLTVDAKLDKGKQKSSPSEDDSTGADPVSVFGQHSTFRQCLVSPYFIGHLVWMSFLSLRFLFFLGSINSMMEEILEDEKEQVSHYTDAMSYTIICGIFVSPIAGFVYDCFGRYFCRSDSIMRQKVMPSVALLVITTTLCLILSCLVLVDSSSVLYAVFVVFMLYRSFLFMMAAGFVIAIFPGKCFGILYGIMLLIAGIVIFLQYAIFQMVDAVGFRAVNLLFVGIVMVTYIHPLWMWMAVKRADKRRDE